MISSCPVRHCLYRTDLNLSAQQRTLACKGLKGKIKKVYPLLTQCSVRLMGSLGPAGKQGQRWQYLLTIPIMLLGEQSAVCSSLSLYPELTTPLSEETMRFSGGLDLDLKLLELSASDAENESCRLSFSARVSMFLSV